MTEATVHASCVALDGRGLLILGASGAGKSRLALALMAFGAALVADDRVALRREGDALVASAPSRLSGLIEARGVGLLRAPALAQAEVALAVDLDAPETQRLPPRRTRALLGVAVPLILRPESDLAVMALSALRFGPPLDPETPWAE